MSTRSLSYRQATSIGVPQERLDHFFRLDKSHIDPAPYLVDSVEELTEYVQQSTDDWEMFRGIPCPSSDYDDAFDMTPEEETGPRVAKSSKGQLVITLAEAKRRFGACLRLIMRACGGVKSRYFALSLHQVIYRHQSDRPCGIGMPPHPLLLALGRNLPGVPEMIRAISRQVDGSRELSRDFYSYSLLCDKTSGMPFLRSARIPGTDHGLLVLAARSGCVEGMKALRALDVDMRAAGAALHEACKSSQPACIRFCIDNIGLKLGSIGSMRRRRLAMLSRQAHGFTGFDLLVDSYGMGEKLTPAYWRTKVVQAIEGKQQILLSLAKRGHRPDRGGLYAAGLDLAQAGRNLLLIAIKSDLGFDAALDIFISMKWAWQFIAAALGEFNQPECPTPLWESPPMPSALYARRIYRATESLLRRGLMDLNYIIARIRSSPDMRYFELVCRHGYQLDYDMFQAMLNHSVKESNPRARCHWHRCWSNRWGIPGSIRELLASYRVEAPGYGYVPLGSCVAFAIIYATDYDGQSEAVRRLNHWIIPGAAMRAAISDGHMQAILSTPRAIGAEFEGRLSLLALATARNLPVVAAFLLLRGAKLHPDHDTKAPAKIDALFEPHGWEDDIDSYETSMGLLEEGDMAGLRRHLLDRQQVLRQAISAMGGSLTRRYQLSRWRTARRVSLAVQRGWQCAREGDMGRLRLAIRHGARGGLLQERRGMLVRRVEAVAAANCTGGDAAGHEYASDGCTLLMAAAASGRTDITRALLALGTDPRESSDDGATAAVWAQRGGSAESAAVLREAEGTFARMARLSAEATAALEALQRARLLEPSPNTKQALEMGRMAAEDRISAAWGGRRTMLVRHGHACVRVVLGWGEGPAVVCSSQTLGGSQRLAVADRLGQSQSTSSGALEESLGRVCLPNGGRVGFNAGMPQWEHSGGVLLKRKRARHTAKQNYEAPQAVHRAATQVQERPHRIAARRPVRRSEPGVAPPRRAILPSVLRAKAPPF